MESNKLKLNHSVVLTKYNGCVYGCLNCKQYAWIKSGCLARLTDGAGKTDESVDVVGVVDVVRYTDGELAAAVAVADHDSSRHTRKICRNVLYLALNHS